MSDPIVGIWKAAMRPYIVWIARTISNQNAQPPSQINLQLHSLPENIMDKKHIEQLNHLFVEENGHPSCHDMTSTSMIIPESVHLKIQHQMCSFLYLVEPGLRGHAEICVLKVFLCQPSDISQPIFPSGAFYVLPPLWHAAGLNPNSGQHVRRCGLVVVVCGPSTWVPSSGSRSELHVVDAATLNGLTEWTAPTGGADGSGLSVHLGCGK